MQKEETLSIKDKIKNIFNFIIGLIILLCIILFFKFVFAILVTNIKNIIISVSKLDAVII